MTVYKAQIWERPGTTGSGSLANTVPRSCLRMLELCTRMHFAKYAMLHIYDH